MTFSDTAMMELGITQSTNIHNTRSLIHTLKYVLDILQAKEAFTVEEYKNTHTREKQVFHVGFSLTFPRLPRKSKNRLNTSLKTNRIKS